MALMLYTCRKIDNIFTITKLDEDYNHEASYTTSTSSCSCPAGEAGRLCKHTRMLTLFTASGHIGDGYFLDWNTRMWRKPIELGVQPDTLADHTILANPETEEEVMAGAIAPTFQQETSKLVASEASHSLNTNPSPSKPIEMKRRRLF